MAKITKSKLNKLMDLSNSPDIDLIKDNNKEYEAIVKGKKDKMKKSSFEDKMLVFMANVNEFIKEQKQFNQEQREFNKKVDSRLDNLETDVKNIKDRLEKVENRLEKVENRLEKVENRLEKVENRLDVLETLPTIKKEIEIKNK